MAKNFNIKLQKPEEVKKLFKTAMPDYMRFGLAGTATRVAYLGLTKSENQMRRDFNLRNNYVVASTPGKGSIQYNKAIPHHDLSKISSSWGSPEKKGRRDYSFLEEQEEGFTHSGPVPTKQARTGKDTKKKVRSINYFKDMQIQRMEGFRGITSPLTRRIAFLKNAFKSGYGLPGSRQFFLLKDGEYAPGWRSGFYQFSRSSPPGSQFSYPNVRRVYYDKNSKDAKRIRRARHWMEISKNNIVQAEIERIYDEEMKKSFTKKLSML